MKTIEEMISVMQAYADGKKIEYKLSNGDCYPWRTTNEPDWEWRSYDYRVKPEPPKKKIVPYESAEEFLAAMKEHGPFIKLHCKSDGWFSYMAVLNIDNDKTAWLNNHDCGSEDGTTFDELTDERYTWQDGTRVGKEVEE